MTLEGMKLKTFARGEIVRLRSSTLLRLPLKVVGVDFSKLLAAHK